MKSESQFKEQELEAEIESFEAEKENIRKIIGKIGGTPSQKAKAINIVFVFLVVAVFALSLMYGGKMRLFMIELGILLVSVKLVYFLQEYMKLNHFQFWVLSSLEWRLDKLDKNIREIKHALREKETS